MQEDTNGCLACKSLSGEKRISPGKIIYKGKFWVIEHAYPTELLGWLIIEPKRHIETLDELTSKEWQEFNFLLQPTIQILRVLTGCEKEYVLCLSEGKGFKHIHFHVIAVPVGLPVEKRGVNVFKCLKIQPEEAILPETVMVFCQDANQKLKSILFAKWQRQKRANKLVEFCGKIIEKARAILGIGAGTPSQELVADDDADTHFNLGIAYKEMGLLQDAINSFETAMKNGYSLTDCLDMIGLSFIDLGEYDKAEKVFREGLARKNLQEHEKLGLSFDLGLALEKHDRLEEALQFYREVEKMDPNFRDISQIVKEIEAKLK